ncbi:CHASE domain-containing protein [Candidatus Microgenomates bacterium]|nr:CHASE domain-containing protein [Candidatus Microgenomates bacterium]
MQNEIKRDLYATTILLMFLLTVNFVVWQMVKNNFHTKTKSDFEDSVFHLSKSIEQKFKNYTELLESGKHFYRSSNSVERGEFDGFYQESISKNIAENQDIVMNTFVEITQDKAELEKRVKDEANQFYYFSVYPDSNQKERYVINYIYPWESNKRYFGYDMKTDPFFSSFFAQALEKGELVVTDPNVFVNIKRQLLIQPIYKNDTKTGLGFIVLFLDPDKMFDSIINDKDYETMDLAIFNGDFSEEKIKDKQPVFLQKNIDSGEKGTITKIEHFVIGNKPYTILARDVIFTSQNVFEKYFPDVNLIISNLVVIGFIVLLIHLKSVNGPS